MDTIDVINHIISINNNISKLRIVSFEPQKDLAKEFSHSWTEDDEYFYKEALNLRNILHLPFWNSLMLSIINGESHSNNCLEGAASHHCIHEVEWINVDDVNKLRVWQNTKERLALNSEIRLVNGIEGQLPMLDFHIEVSERNLAIIRKVCNLLDEPGFILNSGKSYHFIGTQIITKEKLIRFLGKALLFTPIVDEIWIAHQLQDGSCSLRFTKKNGVIPVVVSEI